MSPFRPVAIAAVDIGSPKRGRLGWNVWPTDQSGHDVAGLIELLSTAMREGPCALGFEAPMYVPCREDPMRLTDARPGEGSRAWSAGAGSGALATALVVVPHILQRLRARVPSAVASMDWRRPPESPWSILLFEAFITGHAKGDGDQDDARLAVEGFREACGNLAAANRLRNESTFSLLGAAMLRTGWASDPAVLSEPCLVTAGPTRGNALRQGLIDAARAGRTVTYREALRLAKLPDSEFGFQELFGQLTHLVRQQNAVGEPPLAALVVSAETKLPGDGFFKSVKLPSGATEARKRALHTELLQTIFKTTRW